MWQSHIFPGTMCLCCQHVLSSQALGTRALSDKKEMIHVLFFVWNKYNHKSRQKTRNTWPPTKKKSYIFILVVTMCSFKICFGNKRWLTDYGVVACHHGWSMRMWSFGPLATQESGLAMYSWFANGMVRPKFLRFWGTTSSRKQKMFWSVWVV